MWTQGVPKVVKLESRHPCFKALQRMGVGEGIDLGIPYWRPLKASGYLNERFPGAAEAHKELFERQGLRVVQAGKRWRVENNEQHLVDRQ